MHGKRMRRAGKPVEVHYVGALAEALGKSSWTIRRWERDGTLPPTPLAAHVRGGPTRRLYLTEQIEGVARIAEEEGVAGRKPADITSTRFTERVHQLYCRIFD